MIHSAGSDGVVRSGAVADLLKRARVAWTTRTLADASVHPDTSRKALRLSASKRRELKCTVVRQLSLCDQTVSCPVLNHATDTWMVRCSRNASPKLRHDKQLNVSRITDSKARRKQIILIDRINGSELHGITEDKTHWKRHRHRLNCVIETGRPNNSRLNR